MAHCQGAVQMKFHAKNQTTILSCASALSRFGLAHLHQQTNVSSPFISVYNKLSHAEQVAQYLAERWAEEVLVVSVDTRHFARGPVFRAADLLKVSRNVCLSCSLSRECRMQVAGLMIGCTGVSIWSCTGFLLKPSTIRRLSVGVGRKRGLRWVLLAGRKTVLLQSRILLAASGPMLSAMTKSLNRLAYDLSLLVDH